MAGKPWVQAEAQARHFVQVWGYSDRFKICPNSCLGALVWPQSGWENMILKVRRTVQMTGLFAVRHHKILMLKKSYFMRVMGNLNPSKMISQSSNCPGMLLKMIL